MEQGATEPRSRSVISCGLRHPGCRGPLLRTGSPSRPPKPLERIVAGRACGSAFKEGNHDQVQLESRRSRTHFRIRQARQTGGGIVRGHARGDPGPGHVHDCGPAGRHRLFPAHGRRGRADVRGRQDPRWILPPRGQAVRDGHPDCPPDRPAAAADVPGGISRRGAGRDHRALGRPRQSVRHPGHQRGEPCGVSGRPSVRRPDRRRPVGAHGRAMEDQPDLPPSTWSWREG